MTPPKLEPDAAIPFARAFLVEKYCGRIATEGMKRQPLPMPMQKACASIVCQYSLAREVIINPRGIRTAPEVIRRRKYPASYAGPVMTPMRSKRKAWIEPIQEILLGV